MAGLWLWGEWVLTCSPAVFCSNMTCAKMCGHYFLPCRRHAMMLTRTCWPTSSMLQVSRPSLESLKLSLKHPICEYLPCFLSWIVQVVVIVSVQWRPSRCMTPRCALGLHYPWCLVNGHMEVLYGTQMGDCVCWEDYGRVEDTRAPSLLKMSTFLTLTKVPNWGYLH